MTSIVFFQKGGFLPININVNIINKQKTLNWSYEMLVFPEIENTKYSVKLY